MHYAVTIYLQLFQKFAKNISIIKKRTSRVVNLVPNTCVKFESIPLKTVGGDGFLKKSLTNGQTDGQTDG